MTHPARLYPGDAVLLEKLEERNGLFEGSPVETTRRNTRNHAVCRVATERQKQREGDQQWGVGGRTRAIGRKKPGLEAQKPETGQVSPREVRLTLHDKPGQTQDRWTAAAPLQMERGCCWEG